MGDYFQFEADFVDSLRCIPMQVRLKLDTCGVKLKLHHWHQFTQSERQKLVEMPCKTKSEAKAYRDYLQERVIAHTGEVAGELPIDPQPPWLNPTHIPDRVESKAKEFGVAIAPSHWAKLTPLQRFALIKLSRPSHENQNFYPALQEFGLV